MQVVVLTDYTAKTVLYHTVNQSINQSKILQSLGASLPI